MFNECSIGLHTVSELSNGAYGMKTRLKEIKWLPQVHIKLKFLEGGLSYLIQDSAGIDQWSRPISIPVVRAWGGGVVQRLGGVVRCTGTTRNTNWKEKLRCYCQWKRGLGCQAGRNGSAHSSLNP